MNQRRLESNRIVWADIIKGFAIWLMVFCHAIVNHKPLVTFIYMFHMPVFFIISGYFDKGEGLSWNAIKKTFKKQMIPYSVYSLLGFTICWVSPYLHPELYKGIEGFPAIFKAAFIGMFIMEDNITSYSFMPLGCMWFLVALFICKTIWMTIISCWRWNKKLLILPLSFAILILRIRPPFFSLDSAIISIPFYMFGVFFHRNIDRIEMITMKKKIVVVLVSVAFLLTVGMYNGRVDVNAFNLGRSSVLFFIDGIAGFIACYSIAVLLQKYLWVLAGFGKVSLTILGIHAFFCIIGKMIGVVFMDMNVNHFPLWMSFFIACSACVTSVYLKRLDLFRWLP